MSPREANTFSEEGLLNGETHLFTFDLGGEAVLTEADDGAEEEDSLVIKEGDCHL